jgi:hypothetical protein
VRRAAVGLLLALLVYIAASGKPYPVAILSPNWGAQGSVSFDEWNKPVPISAPKGAGNLPTG